MGVNGKNKGNTFERKIANRLSERFKTYLGIDQGFRRNPDSGSFFGGSNTQRTTTHSMDYAIFGDLICPKNFNYSIECKHYKTPPSLQSIIDRNVKQWNEWLKQAEQDAKNSQKKPALIVKYNNVEELVFLEETLLLGDSRLTYGSYNIYRLSDWLAQPDKIFFS